MSKRPMNSRRRALETGWADGLTRANSAQGGEIRAAYGRWSAPDRAEIEGLKARLEVIGTNYDEAAQEIQKLASLNKELAKVAKAESVALNALLAQARLAAKKAADDLLAASNGSDGAEVARLTRELVEANGNIRRLHQQAKAAAEEAQTGLNKFKKRGRRAASGGGAKTGASGASGAGAEPKRRRRLPKGERRDDYDDVRMETEDAAVDYVEETFQEMLAQQPRDGLVVVAGFEMPAMRPDGTMHQNLKDIPPELIPGQIAPPVYAGRYNDVDYWTLPGYDGRVFYYHLNQDNYVEEWRSMASNKTWREGRRAMDDLRELWYDTAADKWAEISTKFSISSRYAPPRRKARRPRRPRIVDVGADYSMHSLDLNA